MADDLGDEWWKDSKENQVSEEEEGKQTLKRSLESSGSEEGTEATDEPTKKKRKNKRKRKGHIPITKYLKEFGDPPATVCQVRTWMEKEFSAKLTAVEMDEAQPYLENNFFEANSELDCPVPYLKAICPDWEKDKVGVKGKGSPLILIVTSSAVRAVELNRQIQEFKGPDSKCGKLFGKHMKMEQAEKFLKKEIIHIAIGTPGRLASLLKSEHLKVDNLKAIVMDWNWRDVKKYRMADYSSIKPVLADLLHCLISLLTSAQKSAKIGIL